MAIDPNAPRISLASANAAVTVNSQNGETASISIVTPVGAYAGLLTATLVNTAATINTLYFGGQPDYWGVQGGQPASKRTIGTGDHGTTNWSIYCLLSDSSVLTLTVTCVVAATITTPSPTPPTPTPPTPTPPTPTPPTPTPPSPSPSPTPPTSLSSNNPDRTGPGGGSFGQIGVILQGQSNAVFFYDDDSTYMSVGTMNHMVHQLCGLDWPTFQAKADRSDQAANATLFSGSQTYSITTNPSNSKWLQPIGFNTGVPSTWGNSNMASFRQWCLDIQGTIPADRPWILLRMHNEDDAKLQGTAERNIYEAANREFIARWRSYMGGRATNLLPVFQCPVSYDSGTNYDMQLAIRDAWSAMAADPALNFYHGYGSALDAADRGDSSHWTHDSSMRIGVRLAIRLSRWLYENGYTSRNLSTLPTMGPRFTSFSRVPGQLNKLDVRVSHDRGTDIIIPSSPLLYLYSVTNSGNAKSVTGIARQDASTVRLTLGSNLDASGPITFDYGANMSYGTPNGVISDNWHQLDRSALGSIDSLNLAVMIMDRCRAPLTDASVSPTPVVTPTPTPPTPTPPTPTPPTPTPPTPTPPTPTPPTPLPAPATGLSHSALLFNPPTNQFGVNDQFDYFPNDRDWAGTIAHPTEGFKAWRNHTTNAWLRADGYKGSWEPASLPVRRIYRKPGTTDTLVFVLDTSPYAPPVGSQWVAYKIWTGDNGVIEADTSYPLPGRTSGTYSMPLKAKFTVSAGTSPGPYQPNTGATLERVVGGGVPDIDVSPNDLWVRHWSFYKDGTSALRYPTGYYADTAINNVVGNGGYFIMGGLQSIPTWRDWGAEWDDFGQTLALELFDGEINWIASKFHDVDPRKWLWEIENEHTRPWTTNQSGKFGLKNLISDVYYPRIRALLPDVTIGVKGTNFGTIDEHTDFTGRRFDWKNPDGRNTFLLTHDYAGTPHRNGQQVDFLGADQAEWYATELQAAANRAGCQGAGMAEFNIRTYSPFSDWSVPNGVIYIDPIERAKGMGRMLNEFNKRRMPIFGWFRTGSPEFDITDLYTDIVPGSKIEAFRPDFRPYMSRATSVALPSPTPPPTTAATIVSVARTSGSGAVTSGVVVPHTVVTTGLTAFQWVRVGPLSTGYTWQTAPVTVTTTGSASISPVFLNTGEFIKILSPDGTLTLDGSPITVTGSTATPTPTSPGTLASDAPAGWAQVFVDDFTQAATTGINALDASKWGQRSFGTGTAHAGAARWNNGANLESTGTTLKVHTKLIGGQWTVDGFKQGVSDKNPGGAGYHAGHGDFHFRFRARYSGNATHGVGAFALMWPASNEWSSEIDIMEMPGKGDGTKHSMTTIHWDATGGYNLGADNSQTYQFAEIDMSAWHIWDCRRTLSVGSDGKLRGSVRVWVDGTELTPQDGWTNNPGISERMMFGIAGYVGSQPWYGVPDGTTPADSWLEVDYVYGWVPAVATPTPPPAPTPTPTSSRTTLDLAGPGGGTPGKVMIVLKGQSNAYLFSRSLEGSDNAVRILRSVIAGLTGLTESNVDIRYHRSDDGVNPEFAASIWSGSYEFAFTKADGPRWQESNPNTAPTLWPNNAPMTSFGNFLSQSIAGLASDRPVLLLHMHSEYMSKLYEGESERYAAWEIDWNSRYRAFLGGRSIAKTPIFRCPVAYDSGTQYGMMAAQRASWSALAADPTANYYMGRGNCNDAENLNGDASHWTLAASERGARQIGVRIAHWLIENGYATTSQSILPSLPNLGPFISAVNRVTGDATKIDVTVVHDGGTDLFVPASPNVWDWNVNSNNSDIAVTSIARVNSTTLRLSLARAISTLGATTVDYGLRTPFSGLSSQITDNYHTLSHPAPINNVAEIANLRMTLCRMRAPLTLGTAVTVPISPSPTPTPPTPTPPTPTPTPPTPTPTPTFPGGAYITVESTNPACVVQSQNGVDVYMSVVRPITAYSYLSATTGHNGAAGGISYYGGDPDFMAVQESEMAVDRDLNSGDDGLHVFALFSNSEQVTIHMTVLAPGTPPPTPTPTPTPPTPTPPTPTPTPSPTPTLSVARTSGSGAVASGTTVSFTVTSTLLTSIRWVLVGPAPAYVWRTTQATVATTGSVAITVPITETGSAIKVFGPLGSTLAAVDGPLMTVTPPPTPTPVGVTRVGTASDRITVTATAVGGRLTTAATGSDTITVTSRGRGQLLWTPVAHRRGNWRPTH